MSAIPVSGFYVYFHINPLTNKIFYVGKGKENRAKSKKSRNPYWKNTVNKYGGFIVDIIEENLTEQEALDKEKYWITKIGRKNLVNMTDGGDGLIGIDYSNRTTWNKGTKGLCKPNKTSFKKDSTPWNKDIPVTDETKVKISNANKGQIPWNKNIPATDETKIKISNANKGKIPHNKNKSKFDLDLIIELNLKGLTQREISKIVGADQSAISRFIKKLKN